MATEAANAERAARAQHAIDSHMDRIGKSLGFAAPPRGRADTKDSRNAQEAERMVQFLGLVADSVDPTNAGKLGQQPQVLGGIGDGYNHSDEEQRKAAEAQRDEQIRNLGAPAEGSDAGDVAEEEHFAGKPLSEFDAVPDEQLTTLEGVGDKTAHDIVKARHKRDRKAGR